MVKESKHGKYVIIDNGTVLEGINYALEHKIRLCTLKQTGVARDKNLVPQQWYDTASIIKNYAVHDLTRAELKNAKKLNLRLLFLGSDAVNSLLSGDDLDLIARFLGVPERVPNKKGKVKG